MPTTTLVPTSLTDGNSNVAAGAFTDVDETIASADAATLDSVTNEWSPGAGTGSAFTFGLTNMPSEAVSINTVRFRVRAQVTAPGTVDDITTYICDVQGTNAPTTKATWADNDAGNGHANRGASSGVSSSATPSEIDGWTVRVYQGSFIQGSETNPGDDDLNFEIDAVEIIVDYNVEEPDPPGGGPAGGGYTVIPTTDTSIYGLCIAQVRDFIVLGGMDDNLYEVRWSAINDPTDWPTPATDDARAKQAGEQVFPTRFGAVTAISSGDFFAYVFQEEAVTKMTYVGGDIVFAFDTFEEDRGCRRQGRMVQIDDKIFFQSKKGFHLLESDQIIDIGYGVVDDTYG